jgi:hypothetical protein
LLAGALFRLAPAVRPAATDAAALRQRAGLVCFGFMLLVIEYFLDHHRIPDTGNDLDSTATRLTGLDVDIEDVL